MTATKVFVLANWIYPTLQGHRAQSMFESDTAVAEPIVRPKNQKPKNKKQPRYHVILWDDPEHTFEYVIEMMQNLFRLNPADGQRIAEEVDRTGRAICLTTTREHAELKRDQIRGFGRDPHSTKSTGSMAASIEPEF
jgi:ATP-dependent Clp protease adaptor protein ClpS